jgi:hypothetical protein
VRARRFLESKYRRDVLMIQGTEDFSFTAKPREPIGIT